MERPLQTDRSKQIERLKQVEELFDAALRLPADQRAAFLQEACPSDAELRTEVESLLKAADSSDPLLDGSPLSSLAPRTPALRPGDKLGNFEILSLIGRGGMGEVYRARDSRLKREIAIKTLPTGFSEDRDRIARFGREARAASALNHPNIVSVFDIGSDNGVSFIVSELVEGKTLAKWIERGPLPLGKLVETASQIAEGLSAAHAAGVIHRDLKPGNIMLTPEGRVKILDFGLARHRRFLGAGSTTFEVSHPAAIMGTPGYMSPEQVRGERTDERSDIFSLGLVLYEMASGKPAFRGASSVEVMNAVLKDDPPELPLACPPMLDRIVRRCLEKDPARRFQSAADLGFAIKSIDAVQNAAAPRRLNGLRSRGWLAVAAACLALISGLDYWWTSRSGLSSWAPPEGTVRRLTNNGGLSSPIPTATWLRRLTADDGLTTDATISADGKLVAYASDRADARNLDVWVQHTETGAAVRVTSDPSDDYDPSISPDGSQIAFRSERGGGGIYLVPTLGGEARSLIPGGWRPRFSPDGKSLLYAISLVGSPGRPEEYGMGRLFIQGMSGGSSTQIGVGCEASVESAVWSPDGSRVLFWGGCNNSWSVWTAGLNGRLRAEPGFLREVVIDQWISNPSRLLIPLNPWSEQRSDGASVYAVPVGADGTRLGSAERLTFGTGTERHAYAAQNGRMALSSVQGRRHVWGVPVDANGRATGPPSQLTFSSGGEALGALSRDGRKLVFKLGSRLYLKDLRSGSQSAVPWEGGGSLGYPVAASDGSALIFTNVPNVAAGDGGYVNEFSFAGGFVKRIWGDGKSFYGPLDWSPDGSTLLFLASEGVDGNGKTYALDLPSHTKFTLLSDPEYLVWQTHFSSDGHWVTFVGIKDQRARLFVAPFRKQPVPRSEWILISDSGWDDKPHFSSNGKLVFFSSDRDGFRCLWAQPLGPDMHPVGSAFAVYHAHVRRQSLRNVRLIEFNLSVAPNMLDFDQEERTGNIWLMETRDSGQK